MREYVVYYLNDILNMGISDKMDQNNLVQITIKGRNHPTTKKHKQQHSLGSTRHGQSNKQTIGKERGVIKSNLIEIKTEKNLGLNITSRNFTLILSNIQPIKK